MACVELHASWTKMRILTQSVLSGVVQCRRWFFYVRSIDLTFDFKYINPLVPSIQFKWIEYCSCALDGNEFGNELYSLHSTLESLRDTEIQYTSNSILALCKMTEYSFGQCRAKSNRQQTETGTHKGLIRLYIILVSHAMWNYANLR